MLHTSKCKKGVDLSINQQISSLLSRKLTGGWEKANSISSVQCNCLIGIYIFLFWQLFIYKASEKKQLSAFQGILRSSKTSALFYLLFTATEKYGIKLSCRFFLKEESNCSLATAMSSIRVIDLNPVYSNSGLYT